MILSIKQMETGMKKKISVNFDISDFGAKSVRFWDRNYKIFFALVLLVTLISGAYVWYRSLYKSSWSESEREAYRISKDSGVSFKEKSFNEALEIIKQRKASYGERRLESRDIFRGY